MDSPGRPPRLSHSFWTMTFLYKQLLICVCVCVWGGGGVHARAHITVCVCTVSMTVNPTTFAFPLKVKHKSPSVYNYYSYQHHNLQFSELLINGTTQQHRAHAAVSHLQVEVTLLVDEQVSDTAQLSTRTFRRQNQDWTDGAGTWLQPEVDTNSGNMVRHMAHGKAHRQGG